MSSEVNRPGYGPAIGQYRHAGRRVSNIDAELVFRGTIGVLVVHGNWEKTRWLGLFGGDTQPPADMARKSGRVLVGMGPRSILQLLIEAQHREDVSLLDVPRTAACVLLAVIEVVVHLLEGGHAMAYGARTLTTKLGGILIFPRAPYAIALVEVLSRLLQLCQHELLHALQWVPPSLAHVHCLEGLCGLEAVSSGESQLFGGRGEEQGLLEDLIVCMEFVAQHVTWVRHATGVPEKGVVAGGALVGEDVRVLVGQAIGPGACEIVEVHGL